MNVVTFANLSRSDDLEQKPKKIPKFKYTVILSHKPTILKELKGDSFRKESAELNTANQLYTKKNYYECNSLRAVNNSNERQKILLW